MTNRKELRESLGDIEKPHEPVAESFGYGLAREPTTVRLGEFWNEFVRGADESRDPEASPRAPAALPLLDHMKGILQWD